MFGPISMDLYLPALPALTRELDAATLMAQLTVTACLIGLALGQLVAGPLSDRFGRSTPLYAGVIAYVAASLLCAVSPSAELLIGERLVQGIAGTASSLLGMARFAFGGVSAPFVGIAGAATIVPFGVVTVASLAFAVAAYLALVTARTTQPSETTPVPRQELVGSGTH
jgi:MFS family permease